jgi:GH25 family lysozyme M1 (1,4-beta-N-acetylmuramidase)
MEVKGIDCSKWQGSIDWQKAKNNGVEFAITRSGWGKESPTQKDKCFDQNYSGCKAIGIPVGTYHYCYSDSISDAKSEAAFCLKNIAGKQLEYPVIFDVEDRTMLALSTRLRTDICKAFCETIEDAGYYAMIYCNLDWYRNKLYGDELAKDYDMWLAQWDVGVPSVSCGIWQKSDCGKIDGIAGNVDLNEAYKDYPNIMKSKGLNGFNSAATSYKTYEVKKATLCGGFPRSFSEAAQNTNKSWNLILWQVMLFTRDKF